MSILRLDYALLISSVVALGALIPILGAYIGAAVGVIILLLVHPLDAVIFLVFLLILQQVEGNLIYPRVVGSSLDCHPCGPCSRWSFGAACWGFRAFCSAPPPPRCFTGCSAPPCGRGCAHGPSTPRTPACSKRKAPGKLPSQRIWGAIWRIESKALQNKSPSPFWVGGFCFFGKNSRIKIESQPASAFKMGSVSAGFGGFGCYSHSIVAGGLLVISYTTRLTPSTSLIMRLEVRPSRS